MRNSMSFSTADLATLANSVTTTKTKASSNGKNAQYYKERMEAHIADLATSTDVNVRKAVVSSLNASATCLKSVLAGETNGEVIGIILTHPNLSKTVKAAYVKANTALVQSIIESADVQEDEPTDDQEDDQSLTEQEVSDALNA